MRILFVTPECAPLTKTGGLGDVSAALPAALHAAGEDVRLLLPGYPEVLAGNRGAATLAAFEVLGERCALLKARLDGGAPLYVLDCPRLYLREGGPYQSHAGEDWPDNALRFAVLGKVAALLGSARSPLGWRPEVVHCNDWPTALAPVYREAGSAATLLTIHNLAFQGNFPAELVSVLELPEALYTQEGMEFYGRLSFLKAGIVCADALSTVSPRYAAEIRTEEFGCGMHGVLERRAGDLQGILNGIDVDTWDPARDPHIEQRYDARSLELKARNKAALQRRMGLEPDPAIPLLGMVGRLTHQKGTDLLVRALDALATLPAQLAILGKGVREHELALAAGAARHPGRVAVAIGFNEPLAHAIEAGADLFLMPSRFEPCGLNQMYSQRYGTLPVARATGGLADTIVDGENGFLFERAESAALVDAARRGIAARVDAQRWAAMQRAAMRRDFSWAGAARRYAGLYQGLAMTAVA